MTFAEYTPRVAVQDLLDAGIHFGHQTKRWNPKMKKYIYGAKNGIHIIDLEKSLQKLLEAEKFIYDTTLRGRHILFVGTKKVAQDAVRELGTKNKQPFVVNRWLGGALTNLQTIRKSVARLREIEKMEADGTMDKLPKKEVSMIRHELGKLKFNLEGITDLEQLPAAIFVVDTVRESIAIAEAVRLNIPVIAIVDTNSDPDKVDYPIPGNDDASRAIQLMLAVTAETIAKANEEYSKVAAEESRKKAADEAAHQAKAKAEAAVRAASVKAADAKAKTEESKARAAAKPRAKKEDAAPATAETAAPAIAEAAAPAAAEPAAETATPPA